MIYRYILVSAIGLLLVGCAGPSKVSDSTTDKTTITDSKYPEADPQIASRLDAYRDSLNLVTGSRIATVTDTIRFGKPESPLGNIVADAIRFRAGSDLGRFVNIGVIGEGSFRLFLTPGDLSVGDVMEFMPYDNHLVIVSLKGSKVAELAHQIARVGGAPVSGMRFRIENGRARSILVNAQVLNPDENYQVATSSYIADGGDQFPAIWDYTDRIDLYNVAIRDVYVDYFRNHREIYPLLDGRIRL